MAAYVEDTSRCFALVEGRQCKFSCPGKDPGGDPELCTKHQKIIKVVKVSLSSGVLSQVTDSSRSVSFARPRNLRQRQRPAAHRVWNLKSSDPGWILRRLAATSIRFKEKSPSHPMYAKRPPRRTRSLPRCVPRRGRARRSLAVPTGTTHVLWRLL